MPGKSPLRKGYPARDAFSYPHDTVGATETQGRRDFLRVAAEKWWGLGTRLQALLGFPLLVTGHPATGSLVPEVGDCPLILKHRSD